MNPKFDHIPPICILLKLHYAKFDVSRLFRSKVIDAPPPIGKGRANNTCRLSGLMGYCIVSSLSCNECFTGKLNSRIELSYRRAKLRDLVMNCFDR